MGIPIENREIVSARDFSREYAKLMKRLEEGDLNKIVVMHHGKMQAVVLKAEDYEELIEGDERSE
jgi:PHD/YefM family antitoxin component YafN of YafNO toxin-antitoxin module